MSDERDVQRGRMAQTVLDNEVYREAYSLLESEFISQWKASRDPKDREEIHAKLLLLTKVRAVVEGVMKTGRIAEDKIKQRVSLAERIGWKRAS